MNIQPLFFVDRFIVCPWEVSEVSSFKFEV